MKTWEMIKELTENPSREFIRTRDGLVIRTDEKGYLRWEEGHNWINLGDDWEEAKKPVDFMTAIKSGEFIKVEHELVKHGIYKKYQRLDLLMVDLADEFCESDLTEILENGKWYIED